MACSTFFDIYTLDFKWSRFYNDFMSVIKNCEVLYALCFNLYAFTHFSVVNLVGTLEG